MAEASLLGALIASVGLDLTELKAQGAEAKAEMAGIAEEGGGKLDAMAGVGKAAFATIAVSAVAVGAFGLKMADDFEAAHARLETAVENSGKKMSDFNYNITQQGNAFEALGYDNAQYQDALARLTQATNDPTKALNDMGLVANIAAARHMDLTDAATLVGKVAGGNTSVLSRYGIQMDVATGTAKAQAAAQDGVNKAQQNLVDVQKKVQDGQLKGPAAAAALQKANDGLKDAQTKLTDSQNAGNVAVQMLSTRFGGDASAQANTFKGKVDALKASGEDWGKSIGMTLIPILITLGTNIADLINYFQRHKTATEELAAVFVALLLPPLVVYVATMISAAAATIAATWPILAIMAALALLAAGFVYAYNHVTVFHDAVNGFVADFELGCKILSAGWAVFQSDFSAGIDVIKGDWDKWSGDIAAGADALGSGLSKIWGGFKSGFADAINWIIGKWNDFAKTMSVHISIPGVPDINVPQVQPIKFHQGGLVPGSPGQEVAAVLQAGERVVPAGQVAAESSASSTSRVMVTVQGNVYGVNDLQAVITDAMKQHDQKLVKMIRSGVGTR